MNILQIFALVSVMGFSLAAAAAAPVPSNTDWRPLDPQHALYLELDSGRVVIELSPILAPQHVANVQALAKEKYWDGLAIVRVQDNYVVQWADPNSEKPELKRKVKAAKPALKAEFDRPWPQKVAFTALVDKDTYAPQTGFIDGFAVAVDRKDGKFWGLHCYGAVGAGRDVAPDSGAGTELYAVIGHAPRHLDRNVTLLGRVVYGIENLSALPRGKGPMGFYEKPAQNISIKSIRLASEVSEKERTELEVLRTDTAHFKKVIEARRNRSEDWFAHKAGRIDACNVPIPVRIKPQVQPGDGASDKSSRPHRKS